MLNSNDIVILFRKQITSDKLLFDQINAYSNKFSWYLSVFAVYKRISDVPRVRGAVRWFLAVGLLDLDAYGVQVCHLLLLDRILGVWTTA